MPMPGCATSSGRRPRLYRFSRSRRCSLESSRDSRDRANDLRQAPFAGHNDRSNEAAGTRLARPPRGFARFLYSSNPFYIVSADLVFVGLRISFGPGGPASYSWALAIGLATYTLLLATTACFLIRVGKLWDDLRSLLLVIVMMFLAMAMSFDDTMAADSRRGTLGYLAGFAFAVVVSEALLRTIELRLAGWYRAAYYAILALVFLYPIALAPVLGEPESPRLQWALFSFSPLAGLVLLLLVPAARGGAGYVAKNGSPWRWPLYPWSLFFVMAGGICVRCYSLCVSFHFVGGSRTIYAPYFLVPIGLAIALIWLEIGIAARRRGVMIVASMLPLALAFMATTGFRYEPVYLHFLDLFRATLGGSPAFLALAAAAAFHAYAAARKVPLAWELLAVDLIGLAVVGPETFALHESLGMRPLPLAAAGLLLGIVARRGQHSGRAVAAAGLLVAAITHGFAEHWPTADSTLIALQLITLSLMAIGAMFDDWVGQLAQTCAWTALLGLGVAAAVHVPALDNALPGKLVAWSPLFVIVVVMAYGVLVRDRRCLPIAAASLALWLSCSGLHSYQQLRRILSGLDQIACGLLFFVIAAAISFRKAGLWPRPGGAITYWIRLASSCQRRRS